MFILIRSILTSIGSLKRVYYNWRYWANLYKSMKKNMEFNNRNEGDNLLPYINKSGIAFSFDDSFRLNDWYNYGKDMFGYYNVKVTFNINACHYFEGKREHTQKEIDMLLELQSNGHEIGHHGFNHEKATEYIKKNGMNKWMEDEILSLLNWMKKQSHSKTLEKFKKPVTFVFPHFVYTSKHISKLVPEYFKIVRGHLDSDNLTPLNYSGFAPSICLDGYYSKNLYYIKKIIRLVKKTGKNVIFTCHSILPENVNWDNFGWGENAKKSGTWRTTPETIQVIIKEARKIGLEFYTTSEIAGVATFIDPNFEKSVRELISDPSVKWIPISELISIKELDLSNSEVSNLDGIQYFLNLEKVNLVNNKITDYRLLKKLPKLKEIRVNNKLEDQEMVKVNSISKLSFLKKNFLL